METSPIVNVGCKKRIRVESLGVASDDENKNQSLETMLLVTEAVKNCFQTSAYKPTEIDLVLFAGVYRTDFISEPALATMIAGELKINDDVRPSDTQRTFAFDVINGGTGLLTACDIAAQMIRSGKIRNALIIASEVENNRIHFPKELIGLKETASAIIIDQGNQSGVGFGDVVFRYLTEEVDARRATGRYTPDGPRIVLEQKSNISDLYLSVIPAAVEDLLAREGLSMAEIDLVLPPQFSPRFLDELGFALNIRRDRFVDIANDGQDCFTSSLPLSLHEATKMPAKPGDIGLVINVGAGLQVGCAIYRF